MIIVLLELLERLNGLEMIDPRNTLHKIISLPGLKSHERQRSG